MKRLILLLCLNMALALMAGTAYAQGAPVHIQKRYNIFFRVNSPEIDRDFQNNARTLDQMKADIDTTLLVDGAVPDSLLILSTASPDGSYAFNKWLAGARAESTRKYLLEMFPEFKEAKIKVEFLEEDWDGLRQVLKQNPDFPQGKEMMEVISDDSQIDDKEKALRSLKTGWRYLVRNYIHALRNSSITLSVVMTPTNKDDEFVREERPVYEPIDNLAPIEQEVVMKAPERGIPVNIVPEVPEWRKTIIAARTNLLIPGLNFGVEIPIKDNWSIGIDYFYPWAVSAENKWCGEMLGWFIDGKYWFPGKKYNWEDTSRLKGHAVGIYAGGGYYDYQKITNGAQGEYMDVGVDYTFALPVAEDKLRLEFNIGLGFVRTWYRNYEPSTDFNDLIKEPGIKYHTTNFIGPTRASVSLVYPITVKVKHPVLKAMEKQERKNRRKGGKE